jgi:hypothetical protein
VLLGLLGSVAVVVAQGTTYALLTTFTNPTPATSDNFGFSVAAVGSDRVLIGAYLDNTGATDTGAAYLFSTNGALITTFTNPTPAANDAFGISVAAVGTDRVLIGCSRDDAGASDTGAAYLFSTNGTLLTMITNPMPYYLDLFGFSVAAVGTDRVIIGAPYDNTAAYTAGAAYLCSTNGALLATFTKPAPVYQDMFGYSVAALGTDRVLIGANWDDTGATNTGAVYLFSTSGAWLTTFTNPTPATYDGFGSSFAAVGTDLVLIGASSDNTGAANAGVAYLFRTNGLLLTTFTNLAPVDDDFFGSAVAWVGTDRVLIGASGKDMGTTDAGVAYLFSTNGTLLNTFTNPTPANSDKFGSCVAAMGTDRVLIGAYYDDTGATDAGAAYLFSTAVPTPEAPGLTIRLTTTNTVAVSWPSPSTGWTLQQNTNSVASVNWSNAPGTIQDDGTTKALIIAPPTGERFYRLKR